MRRKVLALAMITTVVVAAVGVVLALWVGTNTIRVSLEVSEPSQTKIKEAATDDDGVVTWAAWDGGDAGPDAATMGPLAVRYDKDISYSQATVNSPADNEAQLSIESAYGGYWTTSWWNVHNTSADNDWTLTDITVNGVAFLDCPTMTSVDLDDDASMDLEGCVSAMVTTISAEEKSIIGVTFAPLGDEYIKVALHILDTATPGVTSTFDISLSGPTQTGE